MSFLDVVRQGAYAADLPDEVSSTERMGLRLWRWSVYVAPVFLLLTALTAGAVAEALAESVTEFDDPLLILFTLGLTLFFAVMAAGLAALLASISFLLLFLAVPAGIFLAWSLGSYLDKDGDDAGGELVVYGTAAFVCLPVLVPFVGWATLLVGRRARRASVRTVAVAPAPAEGPYLCPECKRDLEDETTAGCALCREETLQSKSR